jgi:aminocarboxymuconate-semialdehyde decarboxylase
MFENVKKIDVHTHILPEDLPDFSEKFGYDGFVKLEHHKPCCAKMIKNGKFFREIQDNCWNGEKRIHDCNDHDVDIQVLSTIPVLFNYWAKAEDALEVSKFLNNHIAKTVEDNPERFIGLGTIPLQDAKLSIMELERCKNELKMPGVEIGSHVNQWNLSDENLLPFFEAAEDLGMAIFVHPWEMIGTAEMQKYWLPWLVGMPAETTRAICSMIFGGVFEKFPKLRVCFAHGGGSFPATLGRIEHGFNVRPDLVAIDNPINPRNYLGKFFVDSLVHDETTLKFVVDLMGEDFVTLGTDYPFPLGDLTPGRMIEQSNLFNQVQKDKILWKNALKWLDL